MTKRARYAITYGLSGCYMPDSHGGAYEFNTRGDLRDHIKAEMEFYGIPKSQFSQVRIEKLWRHIQRHGSSVAHFSIDHKGYSLSFHGLTLAEFRQAQAEEDA
ncbi:MAG: hypothetical protein EOQ89_03620 [Mesorhizobium sp.]|nr:MAG: hypothetical protein EOQ89_03620 [Mesorhizobium sp.]